MIIAAIAHWNDFIMITHKVDKLLYAGIIYACRVDNSATVTKYINRPCKKQFFLTPETDAGATTRPTSGITVCVESIFIAV